MAGTYYKKTRSDEVNEAYEIVAGTHIRGRRKDRVMMRAGDIFHPTQRELAGASDKFRLASPPSRVPSAGIPSGSTEKKDGDGGKTKTGDVEITEASFASSQAYELWMEIGQPDLSEVAKTGFNGEKWAKGDIEALKK